MRLVLTFEVTYQVNQTVEHDWVYDTAHGATGGSNTNSQPDFRREVSWKDGYRWDIKASATYPYHESLRENALPEFGAEA